MDPRGEAGAVPLDNPDVPAAPEQPLLWAVFEMRETVAREFEELRAALLGLSREEPEPSATPPTHAERPPLSLALEIPSVEELALRPRRPQTRPAPAAPAPIPAVAQPSPAPDSPDARPEDARQRLDALARLLDRRARPSNGGTRN